VVGVQSDRDDHDNNDDDNDHDHDTDELDDHADRDELRKRYYGLLQELRVVLPGVQVLLAFLLTVAFTDRFERLDAGGRDAYAVALTATFAATVCFIAPTVFHRVGERTARAARLVWGVRLMVVGLILVAVGLTAALWCVARYVWGDVAAWVMAGVAVVTIVALWLVLPLTSQVRSKRR
jgi:Flp pilus assembly protein TadB